MPQNSPAEAPEKPRRNGRAAAPKRSRCKAFDGRLRSAKRWKSIFDDAMQRSGRCHESLCRTFASLTMRKEALDAEIASGRPVDVDQLLRLSSEVRRTADRLGLTDAADDGAWSSDRPRPAWIVPTGEAQP